MMEFTFGLLFGMGLGYAAWKSREYLSSHSDDEESDSEGTIWKEVAGILLISLAVYLLIPAALEPLADRMSYDNGFVAGVFGDFLRMLVNYAFYGFILILIAFYKKELAWQIGITLTFCHTAIDWARDLTPSPETSLDPWIQFIIVLLSTLLVAIFVAAYRRRKNINYSMMQILLWSTITVAFISLLSDMFIEDQFPYTDFPSLIVKTLFVHFVFLGSAIYTAIVSRKIST